MFLSLQIVAVD